MSQWIVWTKRVRTNDHDDDGDGGRGGLLCFWCCSCHRALSFRCWSVSGYSFKKKEAEPFLCVRSTTAVDRCAAYTKRESHRTRGHEKAHNGRLFLCKPSCSPVGYNYPCAWKVTREIDPDEQNSRAHRLQHAPHESPSPPRDY